MQMSLVDPAQDIMLALSNMSDTLCQICFFLKDELLLKNIFHSKLPNDLLNSEFYIPLM